MMPSFASVGSERRVGMSFAIVTQRGSERSLSEGPQILLLTTADVGGIEPFACARRLE